MGGIENVVVPGGTALLSEPGDRAGLVRDLTRLVEDRALRQQLGGGGWPHVEERYHYTRLVNDMTALYRSLVN